MAQQVEKLPKKTINWQTVVNVKSDILFMSLNAIGLERERIKRTLGIDYEYETLYNFEKTVAYDERELNEFFELVSQKLQSDKDYLCEFPSRVKTVADKLLSYAKRIGKRDDLETLSSEKLEKIFATYLDKCADAFPLIIISIPLEIIFSGELEARVRETLKKNGRLDDLESYMNALTQISLKETYFQKDYRGLLRLGAEVQSDEGLAKTFKNKDADQVIKTLQKDHRQLCEQINEHNKKYGWINMYGFRRHPFTLVQQIDRLKDILDKDCKKMLANMSSKRRAASRNFAKALDDLEIKGELRKNTEILPELVYLRTYRFDIFTYSCYLVRYLFLEIASRIGVTYDELIHLTLWEISDLLLGKSELSDISLKERVEGFAAIGIDEKFAVISDKEELEKLRKKGQKKKVVKVKEIKGDVACKGVAQGPVCIVMNPTQVTKVKKGDVLVAPMTSPDFVVGMLKAVAIVTDHGGLTCHAAIVSRELNIPCVIGTKIATEALNDGDQVKVDANKGIIKVLDK